MNRLAYVVALLSCLMLLAGSGCAGCSSSSGPVSAGPEDSGEISLDATADTEPAADGTVADSGAPDTGPGSADAGLDQSTPEAALDAAPDQTAPPSDAGPDAQDAGIDAAPTVYNSPTDPSKWATFDLSQSPLSTGHYCIAVFDGRYLYLSPNGNSANGGTHGLVVRLDTHASFTQLSSWSTFDVTTVSTNARGYCGGAYDGSRYVYFSPSGNTITNVWQGNVVRFDTQGTFTDAAAWTVFDTQTASGSEVGYQGAAFDGRYLYLPPIGSGALGNTGNSGLVARYDTSGGFTTNGSWAFFDTTTLAGSPEGYCGGAFDGRYVYLVPFGSGSSSKAARYDTTTAAFTTAASWESFDMSTLAGAPAGMQGAVFDGRYLYYLPDNGHVVARFDTTGTFTSASSWTTFDVTTVTPGVAGYGGEGVFDGRFLYLAPWVGDVNGLTRYDTTAPFGSASSWSVTNLATVTDAGAQQMQGAAFDGEFVYLIPYANSIVARFDAKTPPSMPPSYHGSFY